MNCRRISILTGLSTLAVLLATNAVAVDLNQRIDFSISAGTLADALVEFSKQAHVQVLAPGEGAAAANTGGVSGERTMGSALKELLKSSGFEFEVMSESAIAVRQKSAQQRSSALAPTADELRFAQADAASAADGEGSAGAQDTAKTSAASGAVAQTPTDDISEIIVTAQKRAERLQDVPMTIAAISGADLQGRGIDTYQDLSFAVPELRVHQVIPGQNVLVMRGIGQSGGTLPLVGVYLDEVAASGPSSRPLDLRTSDLDRVEVLHGPQGTLYGQGSAGGTVRFITRDPSFDGTQLRTTLDAAFTEEGSPSQKLTAIANVPVVDGKFAFRVAGTYEKTGGWIDLPAAGEKDINDGELFNIRVKGLWNVTDRVSLNGMVVVHRNDVDSPNGGESIDGNAYRPPFAPTLEQPTRNDYDLYGLTANVDLGKVDLLSATSYYENTTDSVYTTPLGANHRHFTESDRDKVFNQEIRLSSKNGERFNWTVGTFYRDADFVSDLVFVARGTGTVPINLNLLIPAVDKSKSWSYFANSSYKLSDRFEVGGGIRYFDDSKVTPLAAGGLQRAEFTSTDPRVYLSYTLAKDAKVYASVAKGFRSGGFNGIDPTFPPQFEPEKVYTYELGTKFSAWQSRIHGEIAGYYSDYTNMQLTTPTPLLLFYSGNVGKSRVKGVDWTLTLEVTDRVSVGTAGSLVDSQVVEIAPGSALLVGDPLNFVADYNYSLFGQSRFQWNAGVAGLFRIDYVEKGKAAFISRSSNLVNESDVVNMLDARIGAQWERFSLDVYGENLLNDRGTLAPNIVGFSSRSRPRTFGLRGTVNF